NLWRINKMWKWLLATFLFSNPVLAAGDSRTMLDTIQDWTVADAQKGPLEVEVLVIHATTKHKKQDKNISHLIKYFENFKYTGYKLLDSENVKLIDKQNKQISILGNRNIRLYLESHDKSKAKMKVQITDAKSHKLVDTTMVIPRNSHFIFAGPVHDGGILILHLSVKY
ncbi:MAG: hypothetical protein VX278_12100, partial [Myxococcota bacterium]|nr:hypothetical protein [Myxococcota bacterium]